MCVHTLAYKLTKHKATLEPSTYYHSLTPTPAFSLSHSLSACPSLSTYTSFLRNSPKTRSRICLVLTP